MKIKKLLALTVATVLVVGTFVGCGGKDNDNTTNDGQDNGTETTAVADEIYFLNFKPEIADVYKKGC